MKFQDVIAGVMAIILLLAIIAYGLMSIAIPEVLVGAFGIAIGWVFSRGINGQVSRQERKEPDAERSN